VPSEPLSAPESLGPTLTRRLAKAQSEWRLPSVVAAVFRDGEVLWQEAVGLAGVEPEEPATPDYQYRIGSITKTFTAALVMQLRDEGRLELDAPLRDLLPEAPAGPTVRHGLSHLSGFQREPPGDIWETMRPPSREELIAGLEDAERVLLPGFRWHYSNLAFGLLGEIVQRRHGAPYADVLHERLLEPLGLARTTLAEQQPAARGYFVEPYSDGLRVEPHLDIPETSAAMGQLWSTVGDLARWGSFLATGREGVLAPATLDEMALVRAMVDHRRWTLAWGLGLELYRKGERVFVGHGGAMPGFLAAVVVHREERTGAAALTNSSAGAQIETLALELADAALDELPDVPEQWRPDGGAPPELEPLLGRWWSEGHELVFSVRDGRFQALLVGGPPGRDTSWFEREADDRFRIVEGRELGELLRVVRDERGEPVRMYLATYPLTREPSTFG
jgi:CubicO group peptidase (beta-lactamase class C family)